MDAFEKTILSIDIGSQNTKIVEGKNIGGRVLINKVVSILTPPDTFSDGQITNKEKLREAINAVLKGENIKTKNVAFTLESTKIISREIVLPWAKPQELEQIIGFEIGQYLPIEVDKYILQYKIMDEIEEEGVKKVIISAVALPRSISEDYLDLAKSMGFIPHYLDIHSNAVHKLLPPKTVVNDSYPLDDQTIAAIDLGHEFINVTIIDKGQCEFGRLLNNGGKDIDTDISDLFNISLDEAEAKKMEVKNIDYDTEQDVSISLTDMIRKTISDWLEEIQKIFRYYTSRNIDNVIDCICIYGGSSNIEGISTYIQNFFNMPTFKINSLSNVKFNNNSEENDISSYVNAIGAIIRK